MKVTIYTDGSAKGNPNGPGGYGTVLQYVDNKGVLHEKEMSAGYRKTTNNRMELMAAIVGLEALVFSDIVQKNYKMFVMQYEITKIQYMNGKWVLPNGNVWNGELFVDENGSEYHDLFTDCWRSFLAA